MKRNKISILVAIGLLTATMNGQRTFGEAQNSIPRDKDGINVFDPIKKGEFEGLKVDLGGAFAMQFQGLDHKNEAKNLSEIGNSFNLPTANMVIETQLYDGVKLNLELFLSSRHHQETWVKGGYIQIDKLDFIQKDFLKDFMQNTTIKVGQMENNYGDAHLRRSDNGNALRNPLIGNNIMDAYLTEIGMEVYYQKNGFIGMGAITNSKMSQSVESATINSPAFIAKLGYDKNIKENLRMRLTGSVHFAPDVQRSELYAGDRAGSRFYSVITHAPKTYSETDLGNIDPRTNFTTGRINPGFRGKATSVMINPFVKVGGLEFFGTYEYAVGGNSATDNEKRSWSQYVGELLYRFGAKENVYIAGKYNTVNGKFNNIDSDKVSVDRFEVGGGWFMTKNMMIKAAYINQKYNDYTEKTSVTFVKDYIGAKFSGYMLEAVISF